MYQNHSLSDYRERQWQRKYTYKIGRAIIHGIALLGRLVMATVGLAVFALMVASVPFRALVAVARKHRLIGVLAAVGIVPLATHLTV